MDGYIEITKEEIPELREELKRILNQQHFIAKVEAIKHCIFRIEKMRENRFCNRRHRKKTDDQLMKEIREEILSSGRHRDVYCFPCSHKYRVESLQDFLSILSSTSDNKLLISAKHYTDYVYVKNWVAKRLVKAVESAKKETYQEYLPIWEKYFESEN